MAELHQLTARIFYVFTPITLEFEDLDLEEIKTPHSFKSWRMKMDNLYTQ